ncbi:Uncharacterised protein [Mycobacterium tuberculosis]|nr:Uncharacterised protein [Mycobacterium tuberculosis]
MFWYQRISWPQFPQRDAGRMRLKGGSTSMAVAALSAAASSPVGGTAFGPKASDQSEGMSLDDIRLATASDSHSRYIIIGTR